jgi:uncharacterized protein YukE
MAIDDLPGPVVTFLNVIGVEWPYVNEDEVMHFASLVRDFSTAVQTTHQDASNAIQNIARAYQGDSSATMSSKWSQLSGTHVQEITTVCGLLADALEVGAGYIVQAKVEALVQLVELAVEYAAAVAESVATLGIGSAAILLVQELGTSLMDSFIQDLEQYVIGELVGVAIKPLFARIQLAMAGLDWSNTPGGSISQSGGFSLDHEVLLQHTAVLRGHAETFRSHGQTLREGVAGLQF